jgi:hypothetical protein
VPSRNKRFHLNKCRNARNLRCHRRRNLPDHAKPQIGSRRGLKHPRSFHLHLLIDLRLEKPQTFPKKHGHDPDTYLINQSGSQALLSRIRPAHYHHMFVSRRCFCHLNSPFNTFRSERFLLPILPAPSEKNFSDLALFSKRRSSAEVWMRTEGSAISFRGTSLLDEGWCSCSPPRACFKAVAAFFSTGHSLDTLVAQLLEFTTREPSCAGP